MFLYWSNGRRYGAGEADGTLGVDDLEDGVDERLIDLDLLGTCWLSLVDTLASLWKFGNIRPCSMF